MASNKMSALKDDDIVHASWRHGERHEQGIRRGTCGWITSYDVLMGELNTRATSITKYIKVYRIASVLTVN